ncbi:MAG: divergent polysaccharide deacetylase family protein [Pseudomonadota bacterium]
MSVAAARRKLPHRQTKTEATKKTMMRRTKAIKGASRAGSAGLVATFLTAFAGVIAGAFSAYVAGQAANVSASRGNIVKVSLRDTSITAFEARAAIVQRAVEGRPIRREDLERLPAPRTPVAPLEPSRSAPQKPKIIIVFDDMGIDKYAFERILALPGPITLSFLPYALDVNAMAERIRRNGGEIMLHLPMEPLGRADPGPRALKTGVSRTDFLRDLEWNLSRIDGVVGVNNHMGSRLTADEEAMKTTLAAIDRRGLFFLDSLTTGASAVRSAGATVGADVLVRDIFLDADLGKEAVYQQLKALEEIARKTGYAVAIAHPRADTIDVIGPWLTSAPMRGFELAPISTLLDIERNRQAQMTAAATAPPLRR